MSLRRQRVFNYFLSTAKESSKESRHCAWCGCRSSFRRPRYDKPLVPLFDASCVESRRTVDILSTSLP